MDPLIPRTRGRWTVAGGNFTGIISPRVGSYTQAVAEAWQNVEFNVEDFVKRLHPVVWKIIDHVYGSTKNNGTIRGWLVQSAPRVLGPEKHRPPSAPRPLELYLAYLDVYNRNTPPVADGEHKVRYREGVYKARKEGRFNDMIPKPGQITSPVWPYTLRIGHGEPLLQLPVPDVVLDIEGEIGRHWCQMYRWLAVDAIPKARHQQLLEYDVLPAQRIRKILKPPPIVTGNCQDGVRILKWKVGTILVLLVEGHSLKKGQVLQATYDEERQQYSKGDPSSPTGYLVGDGMGEVAMTIEFIDDIKPIRLGPSDAEPGTALVAITVAALTLCFRTISNIIDEWQPFDNQANVSGIDVVNDLPRIDENMISEVLKWAWYEVILEPKVIRRVPLYTKGGAGTERTRAAFYFDGLLDFIPMDVTVSQGVRKGSTKRSEPFWPVLAGLPSPMPGDLTTPCNLQSPVEPQPGMGVRKAFLGVMDASGMEPAIAVPMYFGSPLSRHQVLEGMHKIQWLANSVCHAGSHSLKVKQATEKARRALNKPTWRCAMEIATDANLGLGLGNGYWSCHCAGVETMTFAMTGFVSGQLASVMGLPLDRILHLAP